MNRVLEFLRRRPWVVLAAIWPMILGVALPLGDLRQIGGDEGLELFKAVHCLNEGGWDASVWNDQPLFHTRLYAAILQVSDGALGPRLWSVLASTLLLSSVAALTEALVPGRWAPVLALVTVVLAPLVVELSVSAMQEVPAAAFGLAAVALSARRGVRMRPGLLGIAALSAGVGMAIKLTAAIYLAAAVALTWLDARSSAELGRTRWGWLAGVGLLVSSLLVLEGLLWLTDGRGWEALVLPHLTAFLGSGGSPVSPHPTTLTTYVWRNFPQGLLWFAVGLALLVGRAWPRAGNGAVSRFLNAVPASQVGTETAVARTATGGAILRIRVGWGLRCVRQESLRVLRLLVLPGVALGFNLTIRPWWAYYSLSWFLAIAPISGGALAWACEVIGWRWRHRGPTSGWLNAIVVVAVMAWVAFGLSFVGLASTVELWKRAPRVSQSEIIATLRRAVAGGEPVSLYAADPSYAFWSGLGVAGELVVVTKKRFLSGAWEPEDVPRAVERHDCAFVQLPRGYGAAHDGYWAGLLASNYVLTVVAEGSDLYAHRRLRPRPWRQDLHW